MPSGHYEIVERPWQALTVDRRSALRRARRRAYKASAPEGEAFDRRRDGAHFSELMAEYLDQTCTTCTDPHIHLATEVRMSVTWADLSRQAGQDKPQPGMRVIAWRGEEHRAGVLLPPAPGATAARLDTDAGPVLELDDDWQVRHERDLAERRRDRRLALCPDGRPIYRHTDRFSGQLATATILRNMRRRPAEGQEPIASYMTYKGYAPLYAVADVAEMPPLSARRAQAWVAARTCVRCLSTSVKPYRKGRDGARYCAECQEPAAAAWWKEQRESGRASAAEWARGVLAAGDANPTQVVLLHVGYPTVNYSQAIRAENWDGTLLIEADICWREEYMRESQSRPADVADIVRGLQGRRSIVWRHDQWRHDRWLDNLKETLHHLTGDLDLAVAEGDAAGPHWDEWMAGRNPSLVDYPALAFTVDSRLHRQEPPNWGRATLLEHVRLVITEMATGRCYWWWATCDDPDCDRALWFGTERARDRWSDHHHEQAGHTISHTAEPTAAP